MDAVELDKTPVPNMDIHRLIIRRKMAELKDRLKNTDKVLDETLMTLKIASMRVADEDAEAFKEDLDKQAKEASKAGSQAPSAPEPRKWSITTLYL